MQRIFISLCLIIVLLGVLKQDAQAGSVSGDVSLAGGAARGAVVYLESGTPTTPLTHAVVDQRDKMFLPHVSVVTRGTTVHFPNDDTVFHNVFAYFQAKKFDLGMYPRGATKTSHFRQAGPGCPAVQCPLGHERVYHGRGYAFLRCLRQQGPVSDAACAAGNLHAPRLA